jgi:hypothetical protein
MDVGDIVQLRIYCKKADQASVNVRHYLTTAKAGSGTTIGLFLSALETAGLPADMKALINEDAAYMGIDGQVIFPTLLVPLQSNVASGFGDTAGDPLPSQTSGIITLRTTLGGRANRGRFYIPFPTETDNDTTGKPTSTYVAAAQTLADTLKASLVNVGAGGNTNSFAPVILHRDTMTTTAITDATAQQKWATQRRRGAFGRPNVTPFG